MAGRIRRALQKADYSTECNYSDNYYGDQVCVLRKS